MDPFRPIMPINTADHTWLNANQRGFLTAEPINYNLQVVEHLFTAKRLKDLLRENHPNFIGWLKPSLCAELLRILWIVNHSEEDPASTDLPNVVIGEAHDGTMLQMCMGCRARTAQYAFKSCWCVGLCRPCTTLGLWRNMEHPAPADLMDMLRPVLSIWCPSPICNQRTVGSMLQEIQLR